MKRLLLVFTILFCITFANAQNPFEKYGYTPKIATLSNGKYNEFHDFDTIVQIGTVLYNTQSKQIVAFLQVDTLYSEVTLQPDIISMWMSPDPLADEYPSWSPYTYCANNPIRYIDPTGMSYSEFDENGNYLRTIKDNAWHNFWYGRIGRIVDGDGNVTQNFKFADPKNDVKDLKAGNINSVHFVQESEIRSMLSKAGAFDYENKTANSDSRYDYIKKEGKGGGKFDFSYNDGIPAHYPGASKDPQVSPSPMLFLVDGVAYNHMNFGNFLFGAAGRALGLTSFELQMGAHYNSVFYSSTNGYKPQLDSRDDQRSIRMGVRHANQHGYKNMHYRVTFGPLQRIY